MDQIDIINYCLFSLVEVNFVGELIGLFDLKVRIMFSYLKNLLFLVYNGI
jgi:hypothetical protein